MVAADSALPKRWQQCPITSRSLVYSQTLSEYKLHPELHSAWIGLHIGDLAELATELMNHVGGSICIRPETPLRIRNSEVLMIQRVVNLPSKRHELRFGDMKIFRKR